MPESAPAPADRITPQMAYGSMAGIMTSESDKFLLGFLGAVKVVNSTAPSDDFFLRFAQSADSFTVSCCDRFATFLRESSVHSEVRATSEAVLGRLVRNRCFEAMDVLLIDYLELLKRANINISGVLGQLSQSRVRDSVAQPLPQGAAAGEDGEKKSLLGPQAARGGALLRMLEYLGALRSLAQEFLDYGSSKLFGGDVDFMMQERFLQTIGDGIHEKLSSAISILENLEIVKQKKWEQQRAVESATIKAVAMMASQTHVKKKSGLTSLVIAAGCAAPIWFLFNLGIMNRYVLGSAATLGVAAIFFFFRGVIHLTKG